jgi:predicted lysophospholipase L1 biosynthesis ABC-type transport system permease subunit
LRIKYVTLGAGLKNITISILNQYMILFGVAIVIGAILGHTLATWLIDFEYAYHMPTSYFAAITGSVMMVLVLLITVSTQIRKVFKANPVNGLKSE